MELLGNISPTLRFTVYGDPKSSGNKRISVHGGRAHLYESTHGSATWRDSVVYAAKETIMREGLASKPSDEGTVSYRPIFCSPIALTIVFTLTRPKTAPKKRLWPDHKPDLSKIVRSTEDALKDAGLIVDDALIVRHELWKVFPKPWGFPQSCIHAHGYLRAFELDVPGAVIEVRSL